MSSTKVEICNLALSHLGIEKEIQELETERSSESRAMRRFYPIAVDKVLRDVNWPFATKFETLALVENLRDTDVDSHWVYSYRYPANCLNFRKILNTTRLEARESRVPYRIVHDDDGLLIYTDLEEAKCEFTIFTDVTSLYPPDMVLAISYMLAFLTAARLSGGDPFKKGAEAKQMYDLTISTAARNAFNEEQADVEQDSEFIRIREGG